MHSAKCSGAVPLSGGIEDTLGQLAAQLLLHYECQQKLLHKSSLQQSKCITFPIGSTTSLPAASIITVDRKPIPI